MFLVVEPDPSAHDFVIAVSRWESFFEILVGLEASMSKRGSVEIWS